MKNVAYYILQLRKSVTIQIPSCRHPAKQYSCPWENFSPFPLFFNIFVSCFFGIKTSLGSRRKGSLITFGFLSRPPVLTSCLIFFFIFTLYLHFPYNFLIFLICNSYRRFIAWNHYGLLFYVLWNYLNLRTVLNSRWISFSFFLFFLFFFEIN